MYVHTYTYVCVCLHIYINIMYIYIHIYSYIYISASGVIWFPLLFTFYWAPLAWRMMQLVPVNRSCFWQLMLHEPPVYLWKLSQRHVQSLALYFLNNQSFLVYISILVPSFSPPPVSPTRLPHPGSQPFLREGMASHRSQRSLSQHLGQDQGSPLCILAEKGRGLGKSAHALGIHTGFTASGPTSCPSQTTVTHIGGPSSVLRRFPDISQKSMRSH